MKNLKINLNKGVFLAEIVLSVSIIITLAVAAVYYFSKGGENQALERDRQGLVAILEEARALTLSSKNASFYGVRIETDVAYLFEGSAYVPGDPTNKIFRFNSSIYASSINLSSGGSEVKFKRLSGEAEIYGTITLALLSNSSVTKTVDVLETGVVQ